MRSRVAIASGAFGALVAAFSIAAVLALQHLEAPWIKRRIQALVFAESGADVDYRALRVAVFSGAELDDLVVRSPASFRGIAPELARVRRVTASWSLASLAGSAARVQRVAISGVTVTLVADEHGRTSFDLLSPPGPPPPPSKPVPLSHEAMNWLGTAPPLGALAVDPVSVTVLRAQTGHRVERIDVSGLSLAMSTEHAGTGWRLLGGLGARGAPLTVVVGTERGGGAPSTAKVAAWLTFDVTPTTLASAVDLRVLEQTFAPKFAVDERLHAHAVARFDLAAGRTEIVVDKLEAGDGAATSRASIAVPDEGALVVQHAEGDLDVAQWLRWLPAGLVPVAVDRARLRYRVDSLVVAETPRFAEGGALSLDLDLGDATVAVAPAAVAIRPCKLSIRGGPSKDGVALRGSVDVDGVSATSEHERFDAHGLAVDFDVQRASDGDLTGHAGFRVAEIGRVFDGRVDSRATLKPASASARPAWAEGAATSSRLAAHDGHVEVTAAGLHWDAVNPLVTRGDVVLTADLGELDAENATSRAAVRALTLRSHARLDGRAPYAGELRTEAREWRLFGKGGRLLNDAPAHFDAKLRDVFPDVAHPERSRGVVNVALGVGDITATAFATKTPRAIDYALRGAFGSLKSLRPFVGAELARAPAWDSMSVVLTSHGRVEGIGDAAPFVSEDSEISVEHPAFEDAAARSLHVTLRSTGSALAEAVDGDVHVVALALSGGPPRDEHVVFSGAFDRARSSLAFKLDTEGRARAELAASCSFDRARRAVPYEVEGTLGGLAPLAPLLAKVPGLEGFDFAELGLQFSAHGAVVGVVSDVAPDGAVSLAPHPRLTAGVEGNADVHVENLRWERGDVKVVAPDAKWHGTLRVDGTRRSFDGHVDADTLHLGFGPHEAELAGISDEVSAQVSGDLENPEAELSERALVRTVRQDAAPEYPIGNVALSLKADRDADGVVHVSELNVENGRGGTTLAASGDVDIGARRRRTLSLTAEVGQDLAALSSSPERFDGRGKMLLDAKVESPDLSTFRTHVGVKLDHVRARIPRAGIDVESVDGEIPITVAFLVEKAEPGDRTKITMRRDEQINPYSMLRFADQHPLLSRTGFLSIGSLKTPFISIAPLVGNLEVEQNIVSLRQFEMGVRGGTVSGQGALDWEGSKSTAELHVRANGVRSSHGEPFDGNFAFTVEAADRTVEGRAEILRIGSRHLLDLLDMEDPLRVDPAMNRIRGAMAFGYPDRLRLIFDHGFVSAHLQLGGLARLFSIDDVHGLPMGPIVDRFLASVLASKEGP